MSQYAAVLRHPCGTYAGWNFHKHLKEEPCPACKDAQAQYMRDWRRRTGKTNTQRIPIDDAARQRIAARRKAVDVLVNRHRKEFHRIMADEMARLARVRELAP